MLKSKIVELSVTLESGEVRIWRFFENNNARIRIDTRYDRQINPEPYTVGEVSWTDGKI